MIERSLQASWFVNIILNEVWSNLTALTVPEEKVVCLCWLTLSVKTLVLFICVARYRTMLELLPGSDALTPCRPFKLHRVSYLTDFVRLVNSTAKTPFLFE